MSLMISYPSTSDNLLKFPGHSRRSDSGFCKGRSRTPCGQAAAHGHQGRSPSGRHPVLRNEVAYTRLTPNQHQLVFACQGGKKTRFLHYSCPQRSYNLYVKPGSYTDRYMDSISAGISLSETHPPHVSVYLPVSLLSVRACHDCSPVSG